MPDEITTELFANGGQGAPAGSVAQRLINNGMSISALRPYSEWEKDVNTGNERLVGNFIDVNGVATPIANATLLRKDEWKQYDEALLGAARIRLGGVQDLYDAGLVYNINNGLGTTVLEYENIGEVEPASMNMDAVTQARNDRPEFNIAYLPLPIIHADFQINIRVLEASRTRGQSLDTITAELKTRQILEYLENILFNGTSSFNYGGGIIYGYTDHPNINTVTLDSKWDEDLATGADVIDHVLQMKQALIDDRHFGPYTLYIPTNYERVMDEDYVSGYPKTIRARILEIENINKVKVIDKLSADTVVMVQMTSDVVRIVNGLPLTTVEWDTVGGMISHFKIMTIQVPQIRSEANDRCGVCVLS